MFYWAVYRLIQKYTIALNMICIDSYILLLIPRIREFNRHIPLFFV